MIFGQRNKAKTRETGTSKTTFVELTDKHNRESVIFNSGRISTNTAKKPYGCTIVVDGTVWEVEETYEFISDLFEDERI